MATDTRRCLSWTCRDRELDLGAVTRVMGILNVTPDSFSDGGRFLGLDRALAQARRMVAEGADILDIGGESTRPGAGSVSADEEASRVLPVIEAIARESDVLLSVDTTKASVARAALSLGAHIVNDVSALCDDPEMIAVVADTGAGVILMHRKGTPTTMQENPHYDNVVVEVRDFLADRVRDLTEYGIGRERIAIDPGIGFGKTSDHNLQLLAGLDMLAALDLPLLLGVSRKSVLGTVTGRAVGERLAASLSAALCGVERGAHIIRVHDVKESCDAVKVADRIAAEDRYA